MCCVANFIRFPAIQKFWKSVKIWLSYREFKGGNFFETQCSVLNMSWSWSLQCTALIVFSYYLWRRSEVFRSTLSPTYIDLLTRDVSPAHRHDIIISFTWHIYYFRPIRLWNRALGSSCIAALNWTVRPSSI